MVRVSATKVTFTLQVYYKKLYLSTPQAKTLDTTQNTHLRVLEHTPQIYIDKAGASDREIVMSWDIAYLAMNKNGNIPGNYHGLGAEIMKGLPAALKDPLYIVKQKNGRIAAVTKIVIKGKRAVFASIELEAFQTTIQEGETESKKYNLVVTVTDAKPNYLQNTIFSGDIVYNKNNEDPAHFILRLKSLEKAVPTYDLAESSNPIISENTEKINPSDEKNSKKVGESAKKAVTSMKDNNMQVTDRRYALPEALKSLGEYDTTRARHIESSGKDRVVRDYNEIIDFIKKSKDNQAFERLHIGIISDATSELVKTKTGIDIKGYDFVLASNFIFHIYDSHGNETLEALRGQKAVDEANIENIIETVILPDDVSLASDSGGTALRFEKKLNGRNVAITITSTKKSTLTLKSAWIINENSGGRTPSANAKAFARTPEANSRSSTNNIIPENTEKINPSDEKNSKKTTKDESKLSKIAIDNYAKENVDGYSELNDSNKVAVRTTIRQARYHGISDSDIKLYATVAVKSGLNVMFDASAGDGVLIGNTIYVNPKISAERTHEMLLGHEMFHKIFASGDKRVLKLYKQARKLVSSDKVKAVEERYKAFYRKLKDKDAPTVKDSAVTAEVDAISQEEVAAAGAEEVFKSADAWSYILGEEPTLADKVLGFFRKSAQKYSSIEGLSAQARKFVRLYKKLFDSISESNKGNNAFALAVEGQKTSVEAEKRYALIGRTEDGRGIYRSNYPKNTPKAQKQKDIIDLVQNVWSKKPINLKLIVDGKTIPIEASFNPELTERSDLSKIAFGNRKGTNSEKRITLDLSSDLYQIAEESHHVGSKTETGKDNPAHFGVSEWHYFLTNLVFVEDDGTNLDCYMNIDVKKNDSGHWFYSFAIEKGTAPRTLLAGVTEESATVPDNSIPETERKINPYYENSSKNPPKKRFAHSKDAETKVIHGYTLNKNADVNEDLLEELRIYDPSAEVSVDGRITVYHRTSEESAAAIRKTGIMRAKEDALFFSSKSEGYASDYGDTVLTFKIPSTQLRINDIFEGEVHFDMPLKRSANGWSANVKSFLDEGSRFALPENFDIDAAASKYCYETLIKKPDINVVTLPDTLPKTEEGRINNKTVVLIAKNNAKNQGNSKNTPSEIYVNVKDIDSDVMIRRNGLEHGLARDENTALATIKIGDLLKNGIVINELNGRTTDKRTTEMSYVLFAVGQNKNSPYLVRIIVDKTTNSISEISTHGLYAIKAKKEGALFMPEGNEAVSDNRSYPYLRSTISIADFLEKVKNIPLANEIFSEDVAKKLGVVRSKGSLSDDVRFALPSDGSEIERAQARADYWKSKYNELSGRNKLLGLLMNQAQKMKDLRLGTYANATEADNTLFRKTVEKLARINFRGNLNVAGTRDIIGDLLKWYRKDNPLLEYVDETNPGLYVQDVADMLESLSNGKKGFTKEELKSLLDVMSHFVKFVENYGKVFRNGKMVEALPEAERYIQIMRNNAELKVGLFAKLAGSWYAELFNDPASVVRRMDYYESGFYTEMFEDLRKAAVAKSVMETELRQPLEAFYERNKRFLKSMKDKTVIFRRAAVTVARLFFICFMLKF